MKNSLRKFLPVLALLIPFLAPLHATADATTDAIKEAFNKRHPGFNIANIQPSPIAGLYEVFAGGQILYVSKDAEYVIVNGMLVEDAKKRNITQERMKELTKIDFAKLPFADAIEIKKGDGAIKFVVFSDPECPYCQQLEKGLDKLNFTNYTAYVFLFPLETIHKDARWQSEAIWCSKDRAATWHEWMVNGKTLEKATCDNPIDRNEKLGEKIGVQGTPAIYLDNGMLASSPQELVDILGKSQPPKAEEKKEEAKPATEEKK